MILLLLSSILNSLITSWVALKKSQYSFEFIGLEEVGMESNLATIPVSKIEQLSCRNLCKKWDERLVFNKLNFEFNSGELPLLQAAMELGNHPIFEYYSGIIFSNRG